VNGHMCTEEVVRVVSSSSAADAKHLDDDCDEDVEGTLKWRGWSGSWSTFAAKLDEYNQYTQHRCAGREDAP
jgi:hypothetical protein